MREFDIASASAPQGQVQLVAQSMLREAWGHLRAEEWTQAERVLSAALVRAPEHPGCLAALAICLAEGQRRFLSAEKLARKAVKLAPRDPEGCYALGVVYARGGRLDQARRWLRRADRLGGGHLRAAAALTELGSGRRSPLGALSGAAVMAAAAVASVASAGAAGAAQVSGRARGAGLLGRLRPRGGRLGEERLAGRRVSARRGRRPALVLSLVMVLGVWTFLGLYGQEVEQRESEVARLLSRSGTGGMSAAASRGPGG